MKPLPKKQGIRMSLDANRAKQSSFFLWSAFIPFVYLLFLRQQQPVAIPTPKNEMSACKLHYSHFHIFFTLPQLSVLYFLARPFLTQLDYSKLILLPIIAFIWTTPWDNELVRQNAWWYPRSCVLARIGYVPIEEYAFFILQSLITTLFTILITRWTTPRSFTQHISSFWSLALPSIPLTTFILGIRGLLAKEGFGHHFYISMIAWWASVPLILLWYGTRRSWLGTLFSGQFKSHIVCLVIPTVYLCLADAFALRRGTWHITEAKSLEKFVFSSDLPWEEAIFFFATNLILISACFAFDRVVWQCRSNQIAKSIKVFNPISPTFFPLSLSNIPMIWSTFLHLDNSRHERDHTHTQSAQDRSLSILQMASKSFHTASTLLPWDLRVDLGCLYAFARAMDDFIDTPIIDNGNGNHRSRTLSERIDILRFLIQRAISLEEDVTDNEITKRIENVLNLHPNLFAPDDQNAQKQKSDLQITAEAVSALRTIVPIHLWEELLEGFEIDCELYSPRFQSQKDQILYAQYVAGSIGDMCVRVVLARSGVLVDRSYRTPLDLNEEDLVKTNTKEKVSLPKITFAGTKMKSLNEEIIATLLRDARRMGVSLQLINIARDVATDAQELKRCYLALDDKKKEDFQFRSELKQMQGRNKFEKRLLQRIFDEKMKLVTLARSIYLSSFSSISLLPDQPAQTGLRAACAVYLSIGDAIEKDGVDNCCRRSKTSAIKRMWVVFKAMYL